MVGLYEQFHILKQCSDLEGDETREARREPCTVGNRATPAPGCSCGDLAGRCLIDEIHGSDKGPDGSDHTEKWEVSIGDPSMAEPERDTDRERL